MAVSAFGKPLSSLSAATTVIVARVAAASSSVGGRSYAEVVAMPSGPTSTGSSRVPRLFVFVAQEGVARAGARGTRTVATGRLEVALRAAALRPGTGGETA